MASVGDALRAGDIAGAVSFATAAVKAAPTNADARWLLAELLLVAGEVDRADRVLDAATLDGPNVAVLEFRQLLRAEVTRAQVLREGRAPKFQGDDATAAQHAAMRARVFLKAGDTAAATEAAAEVEALRRRTPGRIETIDGTSIPFDDLRDADDLQAAEFEVLTTAGDHILVPIERVRSAEFDAPRRTRDLIWRRCTIDLRDSTEGVVYMPALYLVDPRETDSAIRLGRATEWSDPADGPVRGRGQRLLLAGEEPVAFTSIATLVFD